LSAGTLRFARPANQAAAMTNASRLQAIISGDPTRWRLLEVLRSMRLPDCWIGAGFVRNTVWDCLHGRALSSLSGDVDVVWFDPARADPSEDRKIEAVLRTLEPSIAWDVKNQARMHVRNGDAPYLSATDAMRCFPETATAVAVRRSDQDHCDVAAPFGLDDLFGLIVRPTPRFADDKRQLYGNRIQAKRWLETWPLLRAARPAN
jgi:hypothetical protein